MTQHRRLAAAAAGIALAAIAALCAWLVTDRVSAGIIIGLLSLVAIALAAWVVRLAFLTSLESARLVATSTVHDELLSVQDGPFSLRALADRMDEVAAMLDDGGRRGSSMTLRHAQNLQDVVISEVRRTRPSVVVEVGPGTVADWLEPELAERFPATRLIRVGVDDNVPADVGLVIIPGSGLVISPATR